MRVEHGGAVASAARTGSRSAFPVHEAKAVVAVAIQDPEPSARVAAGRLTGVHGQAEEIGVRDAAPQGHRIAQRAIAAGEGAVGHGAVPGREFASARRVPGA